MKYSRSVFTSVAFFSSSTSIRLLGKKFSVKYSLGLVDWLCVCCQNSSNKNPNVGVYFFACVKLDCNVAGTLLSAKFRTHPAGSPNDLPGVRFVRWMAFAAITPNVPLLVASAVPAGRRSGGHWAGSVFTFAGIIR